MKITKISKIPPLNLIPREHQRWCGLEEEKEERKKTPEILEGELILYNRYGRIEKHGCSEKGAQDDN